MPSSAPAPTVDTETLPVLDLRDFTSGDPVQRAAFVTRLRETAHHVGFFYLRGYGAGPSLVDAVLQASRAFFALPQQQKQAVHMVNSPHFRGYTAAGDEVTRGARDWREQFDIGAERVALAHTADIPAWARLQGPNQWPDSLPQLRPTLLAWQDGLTEVGRQLLRALALALGQPEDGFEEVFAETPMQHLKIIRYPGRSSADAQQGVGAHKDGGCLTLLLQDTQAGLQVLERDGPGQARWREVPPVPGTLVVNLGEVLEVLSNGYLRATVHRVVSPPQAADRLSVAFFSSPRLDTRLPELVLPPAQAVRARGVERDPLNPLLAHTGRNLLKGRLRSHPDVAARFYADVLAEQGLAVGTTSSAYA